MERAGVASLRFGSADGAAPIAQTLLVQNVIAGTSNTAGVSWTLQGSRGTGSAVGGGFIFQTAPAGTAGTSQNALVTALSIFGDGGLSTGAAIDEGAGTLNLAGSLYNNGTAPTGTGAYVRSASPSVSNLTVTSGFTATGLVGLSNLANISANTVIGSIAGGTPAALTQTQLTTLINPATASLSGALPAFPNNTTTYFRGDGTYQTLNAAALTGIGSGVPTALNNAANASGGIVAPTPTRAGDIALWNGSSWTTFPGNNSGTQLLQESSLGVASWVTISGTGTVTNVATNGGTTGGPITSTGTIQADGNYSGWALGNCTLAASVGSNLLTVALKDNAGNNPSATSPCNINYRSATAATGSTTLVQQTAALSISTNATGATLGAGNNAAFRFWVVSFNNSGTNVLALFNASTSGACFSLPESVVASTTPISGSATSAGVFYTPNGTTVTSQAYRILGYVEYNSTGLATAGTYASAPNFIQTFGPGIRKPCEPVQQVFNSSSSATTGSGTTFVAATPSASITPTSAANTIVLTTNASVEQSGSGGAFISRIYRNARGVGCLYHSRQWRVSFHGCCRLRRFNSTDGRP